VIRDDGLSLSYDFSPHAFDEPTPNKRTEAIVLLAYDYAVDKRPYETELGIVTQSPLATT